MTRAGVVIVVAFFVRHVLPHTSNSVVCCIIRVDHQAVFQHRQFCKSRNQLRDTIFQAA